MNKSKNKLSIINIIIIFVLMFTKIILNKNTINVSNIIVKDLLILFITILTSIVMKEKKKNIYSFHYFTILLILLSCIFKEFDYFAFILLYYFILLITTTFMTITKYKFEVSIIGSVFTIIILFIVLGLIDVLKYSRLFLLIITITSLIYLYRNKKEFFKSIDSINPNIIMIFTILFAVAITGGIGRYVHSWDEYSYWGYAAKVCINEQSLLAVIEKLGNTRNYPPVSTIWHYIVSSFNSGFSEPNLYIGLTTLIFISFMPVFSNIINKQKKYTALFIIAVLTFPTLFSGAYYYSLIYVDLLLAAMCTTTIILFELYQKKEIDKKLYILSLVLITLLKPNGFIFACTLILLFYLRDLTTRKIKIKNIFSEMKKYIIPATIVILLFVSWTLFTKSSLIESTSYDYNLMPAELKSNIGPKLEMKFILNFVSALISSFDKKIIISFINIPLFVYLIIIGGLIYLTEPEEEKNSIKILLPYIISYIVFYLLTALSLFVMFSKYEAENLASFGRYLTPINIAFFVYGLYRITNIKKKNIIPIILIVIIGLVGFSNSTFFLTDIRERRDTQHIYKVRNKKFKIINEKTEKNAKVFVINQEDEDTIMPLWYARYYCYPRVINSSSTAITWKVKTKENAWDLKKWGLTDRKLEKHLIDYGFDYIYFYTKTDELEQELDEFVDDVDEYDKGKLFKIIKEDNNKIKFELVK